MSDNATKPRDVRQIKLRIAEWRSEAFSRDELYQDCETLIEAYDALQKQLDEAKAEIGRLGDWNNKKATLIRNQELEAENTRLRELADTFDKYADHRITCPSGRMINQFTSCTCGLREAREALKKEGGKNGNLSNNKS